MCNDLGIWRLFKNYDLAGRAIAAHEPELRSYGLCLFRKTLYQFLLFPRESSVEISGMRGSKFWLDFDHWQGSKSNQNLEQWLIVYSQILERACSRIAVRGVGVRQTKMSANHINLQWLESSRARAAACARFHPLQTFINAATQILSATYEFDRTEPQAHEGLIE